MSDVVRDYLCWRITAQELRKEVADLRKRIEELTVQLQDEVTP